MRYICLIMLIMALMLSSCAPINNPEDVVRELEPIAKPFFEQAQKEIEKALQQQAEEKKDEVIQKYVGKGAPPKTVTLFVSEYKAAFPDIGFPTGEVKFWNSVATVEDGFYGQEFFGSKGKTILTLWTDEKTKQPTVYNISGSWLTGYEKAGGPAELGPPTNKIHDWNDDCTGSECRGRVQNFGEEIGAAVLMQRQGTDEVFVVQGEGWLNTYLKTRGNGIIGYPTTNKIPYGVRTGWFGLGGFKQQGMMQFFNSPSGLFALVSRDGSIEYCDTPDNTDINNSEKFPCITEPDFAVPTPAPVPAPTPPQPSPSPSPEPADFEDDSDNYGLDEGNFVEYWDSLEQLVDATDFAFSSLPPQAGTPLKTGSLVVKGVGKIGGKLLKIYRGNKLLQYGWRGLKMTDKTFDGLKRLDRRIRGSRNPKMPWLERGLKWQKQISEKIGIDKFDCVECPVSNTGRSVDGKLAQDIHLAGKTIKKGDFIEFKDYSSGRSIDVGLSHNDLKGQIIDYAKATGGDNKLYLVFHNSMPQRSIDLLLDVLKSNNISNKVEIINGIQ